MVNDILLSIIFCSFIATIHCFKASDLTKMGDSGNRTRTARQIPFYDLLLHQNNNNGYTDQLYRIAFNEICDGRVTIALGACNNIYVRCTYDPTGQYVAASPEECPIGKIFNGAGCNAARDNCLGTWTKQMEKMNYETEELLEDMDFCYRGSGIYVSPASTCSRQAYACINQNQGSAITCPPGMILLWRPFGCFAYPPECAPGKIPMEKFAPLRQFAIEEYCDNRISAKRNDEIYNLPKLECNIWYVECRKPITDIVYCEHGMIHDEEQGGCRLRKPKDRCILPDICKNHEWDTLSLGDCSRHFIYCRGRAPEEFVCAKDFIFSDGRCVPQHTAGSRCWKCQNGEKRHTPFHSCSEYSVCKNGRWMEETCSPGMSYYETGEICRPDPSCALPVKCKVGKSYHLKCNEYMICTWKGVFEHRFCPPFHRWDIESSQCLPDTECVPSSEQQCSEGEIVDSFDCEFYHQCIDGKWNAKPCPRNPAGGVCTRCLRGRIVSWRTNECLEGDTMANPQDCASYATCDGGVWRSSRCGLGLFWNQYLRRCDYSSNDCKSFKRADCTHGQRLIGKTCNEYLECIHGSWVTMQCLAGYAFDVATKLCVLSDRCVPSKNSAYLSLIDHDTAGPSSLFELIAASREGDNSRLAAQTAAELGRPCPLGSTIRDEYDCSRYFECTTDGYRARYCNDNYEFNDVTGRCEKGYRCDLSRCQEGQTIEGDVCGQYQICRKGVWRKAECGGNRQFFDGRCQTALCDSYHVGVLPKMSCKSGSVAADDADCSRYFICRNGRYHQRMCKDGSVFDKKRGYCSRNAICKSKEHCAEGEVKPDKHDCTAYRYCKDGKFKTRYCPYGLIYNHGHKACEDGTCVGGTTGDTCKESGGPDGYRADPVDCRKFYQCAQGKWVSKDCPANLFWNREKSTCDWPNNVTSCSQRRVGT